MSQKPAAVRGAAFAVILVAAFAAASLAGAKMSPSVDQAPAHDEGGAMGASTHQDEAEGHATHDEGGVGTALSGLASAEAGYRLILGEDRFDAGTWVAEADFRQAGVYRAFADFSTGGRSLTLASDVFVAGRFEPQPLPAPATSANAGDGYEVEIDTAAPAAGTATPVRFLVRKDGELLKGVEPYLDADGHLVALREHDQAFLHTHPEGEPGGMGPISFQVVYPTPGNYRPYLQFKDGGEVHTAAFTQSVAADALADPPAGAGGSEDHAAPMEDS